MRVDEGSRVRRYVRKRKEKDSNNIVILCKEGCLMIHVNVCTYMYLCTDRSDARYKAHVIDTRLHKEANTLVHGGKYVHVYTQLNGFIQGDKCIYMRRETRLPYTLH